jgi:ribosomal protein S18 acetylase RimI-like enzyme
MPSTAQVEIVAAGQRDLDEAAQLFDAYRVFYRRPSDLPAARQFLAERLARRDSTIFLARRHGVAVGFVQLYPSWSSVRLRPIWILNDLYVAPGARAAGVGRRLMDRARELARDSGAARLELTTERTNKPAQALYRSAGYARDNAFFKYVLTVDTRA